MDGKIYNPLETRQTHTFWLSKSALVKLQEGERYIPLERHKVWYFGGVLAWRMQLHLPINICARSWLRHCTLSLALPPPRRDKHTNIDNHPTESVEKESQRTLVKVICLKPSLRYETARLVQPLARKAISAISPFKWQSSWFVLSQLLCRCIFTQQAHTAFDLFQPIVFFCEMIKMRAPVKGLAGSEGGALGAFECLFDISGAKQPFRWESDMILQVTKWLEWWRWLGWMRCNIYSLSPTHTADSLCRHLDIGGG